MRMTDDAEDDEVEEVVILEKWKIAPLNVSNTWIRPKLNAPYVVKIIQPIIKDAQH